MEMPVTCRTKLFYVLFHSLLDPSPPKQGAPSIHRNPGLIEMQELDAQV